VLSTRRDLVDRLGCARGPGERDMRERGVGGGGRATEAGEGGRVQVRGTAQGGLAEVHQCTTPGVVEHQRASEGEKGKVAYIETARLEGTTAASRPSAGLFMGAQACRQERHGCGGSNGRLNTKGWGHQQWCLRSFWHAFEGPQRFGVRFRVRVRVRG
jgi:hypothetical protein